MSSPNVSRNIAVGWPERRIMAYAHQGGAWEGPSSTLFAIRQAIEAGASAIELDVHATADGELVVSHDATVDRTTNGQGTIATMRWDDVRQLDNAYWWAPGADVSPGLAPDAYPYRGMAPKDRDFRVARLEEVLQEFPGVILNLDIKQTAPAVPSYEEPLAELLRKYDRVEDVIVASFLDLATERFHALAPEIPTAAGTLAVADFYRAVRDGQVPPKTSHVALQVPVSFGDTVLVDARFVEVAHECGLAVHVWTIEEETEMAELCELGVDGIITDRPGVLVSLLRRRGQLWPEA
jgi:glycerophosphoryl diester phosphodiesterase